MKAHRGKMKTAILIFCLKLNIMGAKLDSIVHVSNIFSQVSGAIQSRVNHHIMLQAHGVFSEFVTIDVCALLDSTHGSAVVRQFSKLIFLNTGDLIAVLILLCFSFLVVLQKVLQFFHCQ